MLLSSGFTPRRTIVLSNGFDEEEVQARQGAGELAKILEEKYGQDSMLMIVDEGGSAARIFDTAIATIGSSEKGYAGKLQSFRVSRDRELTYFRHRDFRRYARRPQLDPARAYRDWHHERDHPCNREEPMEAVVRWTDRSSSPVGHVCQRACS